MFGWLYPKEYFTYGHPTDSVYIKYVRYNLNISCHHHVCVLIVDIQTICNPVKMKRILFCIRNQCIRRSQYSPLWLYKTNMLMLCTPKAKSYCSEIHKKNMSMQPRITFRNFFFTVSPCILIH
jgi:hypothetical protein